MQMFECWDPQADALNGGTEIVLIPARNRAEAAEDFAERNDSAFGPDDTLVVSVRAVGEDYHRTFTVERRSEYEALEANWGAKP